MASARVIKSFVREDYEVDRFDVENRANFRANMKNAQLMATLTPVVELVAAIGVTMIIWYGGNNVINGTITAGSLVAFLTYAVNISNPIKRLTRVIGNIQKALAAAQRVFMIIDMPEEIAESRDAKQLPEVSGKVEFQNVSFAYDDKGNVITDLSFSVKPGEVIAIVGPSGAGKSTIANLLPRFYDVNKGDIKIDGHSVREVTLDSLREQVGIVPQETMLLMVLFIIIFFMDVWMRRKKRLKPLLKRPTHMILSCSLLMAMKLSLVTEGLIFPAGSGSV